MMQESFPDAAEPLVETRIRYAMEPDAFYGLVAAFTTWDNAAAITLGRSQQNAGELRGTLATNEFNLNEATLNNLFASFKQPDSLDPYQTTLKLEACSPLLAATMAADSGLLRPQRGREQIEAELRGFEEDYLPFFQEVNVEPAAAQHVAELRQIVRATGLLRTVIKPFVNQLTGKNWQSEIKPYFDQLSDALFAKLNPAVMTPEAQQVVRLFGKYDIAGKLLWDQGYNQAEHQQMRDACPEAFKKDLDDLILISYLCSGGAHTSYRWFTNRDAADEDPGKRQPAVLDIDQQIQPQTGDPGTLDRFFMRSTPTSPLKLEPATRRRAAKYLNCTDRTEKLLRAYNRYAVVDDVWSATLELPSQNIFVPDVERIIDDQVWRTGLPLNTLIKTAPETGMVQSVSFVRDPSSAGAPLPDDYEAVVKQLTQEQRWQRRLGRELLHLADAYACIGLVPGYDPQQRLAAQAIPNAMSLLSDYTLEQIGWSVDIYEGYAAWRNDGNVLHHQERMLVVRGLFRYGPKELTTMHLAFNDLAAFLGQRRFYGGSRAVAGSKALTFAEGS